jgi:hypothetical protein
LSSPCAGALKRRSNNANKNEKKNEKKDMNHLHNQEASILWEMNFQLLHGYLSAFYKCLIGFFVLLGLNRGYCVGHANEN